MKESVALAKDTDAKKNFSSTRSDNSIMRLRNEPERQLGSLRSVIGNIRHDGGTPSLDSIATELSSMHTAQRASVLLALQRTHGNRYVQRVVAGIQAKLVVGQPGDVYDQEADRVADEVMRMPEPQVQRQIEPEEEEEETFQTKPLAERITPLVQRQAEEKEEEEEEEILQTKENPGQTPEVTPDFKSRIQSLKGGGQPLPEVNRGFMERRFGIDFSGVRLHRDSDAAQMSRELNAEAFTYGRDIYFGVGKYSPDTSSGKKLLAHELTHVVQQSTANSPSVQLRPLSEEEKQEDIKSEKYAGNPRLEKAFDNEPPLRLGERGEPVKLIQEGLRADGFYMPRSTKPSGEMDGIFGSETFSTIKQFQSKYGLDVDGIVGRQTMGKLDELALAPLNAPPGTLPPCPGTPEETEAFVGGPTPGIPAWLAIPGLTCQHKGITNDKLDLARVRNVKLIPKPGNIERGLSSTLGKVYIFGEIFAEASAELTLGITPADQFSFGFIQVCRPYSVVRAVYRKPRTTSGTGNDLDWTATMKVRQKLPALDHLQGQAFYPVIPEEYKIVMKRGVWAWKGKQVQTIKASKGKVPPVTFWDKPQQVFLDRKLKHSVRYDITGFSWQSYFFTAYVVKLPSGKIEPLKTFYWKVEDCMKTGANLIPRSTVVGNVRFTPVRDCFKHHCDRGEPGFKKAGTTPSRTDTCNYAHKDADPAIGNTPYEGPSDYRHTC